MKILIEIKNRWTGSILFSYEKENNTIKDTVLEAIAQKADLSKANLSKADLSKADLSEANLSWANLSWADLSWADLSEADLSKADLSWANLSWADLSEANLSWANLSWADLSEANLSKADLSKADLSKADLSEADLSKADLSKANLSKADLSAIKNDLLDVIVRAIPEIPFLKDAIINGKVNGSTYSEDCACLVGTIAHAKKCHFENIPNLKPNSRRLIERFFLGIKTGDTPETNTISKIVLEWINEYEMFLNPIILKNEPTN